MAASFSNPEGAVGITDGGTPRVITVKARTDISAGYWVAGSTAAGAVGSSSSSYSAGDIEGFTISTVVGSNCIGLALADIASGTYGPVAQRGMYLLPCASGTNIGSIVAGMNIAPGSAGTVVKTGSSTLQDYTTSVDWSVGRAMSTGGGVSEQFVAVSLNI
jgi:predicted RecA/RadA family phage recombinase